MHNIYAYIYLLVYIIYKIYDRSNGDDEIDFNIKKKMDINGLYLHVFLCVILHVFKVTERYHREREMKQCTRLLYIYILKITQFLCKCV